MLHSIPHLDAKVGQMHRIRLREPWAASLNAQSNTIIYSRKFHRPTGVDDSSLSLKIFLLPPDPDHVGTLVSVQLNGRELFAQPPSVADQFGQAIVLPLSDLQAFNSLELWITDKTGVTTQGAPIPRVTAIPTFGSFVIESVELQID